MSEENQNAEAAENQTEENVDSTETKESTDSTCSAENNEKQEQQKEPTDAEKIAALEKENAELKDQLLRRAADFDNYRKRMLKEKQD
ncbi:nucleotide exchange factor GrpE, partial [Treponema porcinum]